MGLFSRNRFKFYNNHSIKGWLFMPIRSKELQKNRDDQKTTKEQEQFRKAAERKGQVVM